MLHKPKNFYLKYFIYLFVIDSTWYIMLIVHEFGHTITAKILGDNNAYFKIVEFNNGKLTAIGSNQYNIHTFNWWQIIIVSLAGVGFTYILALAILFLKNIFAKNKKIKKSWLLEFSLNSIIFWSVFDLVFQEIQGLFANIVNRVNYCGGTTGICGNDFADVFWILYEKIKYIAIESKISIHPSFIIFLIKLLSLIITSSLIYILYKYYKNSLTKKLN